MSPQRRQASTANVAGLWRPTEADCCRSSVLQWCVCAPRARVRPPVSSPSSLSSAAGAIRGALGHRRPPTSPFLPPCTHIPFRSYSSDHLLSPKVDHQPLASQRRGTTLRSCGTCTTARGGAEVSCTDQVARAGALGMSRCNCRYRERWAWSGISLARVQGCGRPHNLPDNFSLNSARSI